MHNYDSAPDNVRGIVEFKNSQGTWVAALGNPVTKAPTIFSNKSEAMSELLASMLGIALLTLGGRKIRIPEPEEFRFVPVEVPAEFDREPADFMAASDVLKAAAAKAKGGVA